MAQENGVDSMGKREKIVVVLEVECILGVDNRACFCISARTYYFQSRGTSTQGETYIWRQVCNRLVDPSLDLLWDGRGLW